MSRPTGGKKASAVGDREDRPYEGYKGRGMAGRCGERIERRQWRMKRGDFEEVPRLAATTVAANRLARRWATAGPYGA